MDDLWGVYYSYFGNELHYNGIILYFSLISLYLAGIYAQHQTKQQPQLCRIIHNIESRLSAKEGNP